MRFKSFFAGIALACLSVLSNPAFADAGPWVETTTPVLASATYTGTSHYLVAAGAGTSGASFFGAQFYADQDGTAYVDSSNDGSTWTVASTKALTGTHTVDLNVPMRASYYRVRFVNGGTNQGAFRVFAAQTQSGTAGQTTDGAGASGGGSGGGDASAANQTSQITQATATNTVLGAKTDAKSTATDATSVSQMQVQKQISASAQAAAASLGTIVTNTTGAATAANQASVIGTKAPGTAAASSQLIGGVYNSSDPTLTNGQQAAAQMTSKGEVRNHDTDLLAAAQAGTANTGVTAPGSAVYFGANSSGLLTGIIQADKSAIIDMSTATTTQIIALSGSLKTYITGWNIVSNGTATSKLVYGTGTNCGTGTTALTPAYDLIAQAGLAFGGGLGPILIAPAGQAVCHVDSAAVHEAGTIAYTQAP